MRQTTGKRPSLARLLACLRAVVRDVDPRRPHEPRQGLTTGECGLVFGRAPVNTAEVERAIGVVRVREAGHAVVAHAGCQSNFLCQ